MAPRHTVGGAGEATMYRNEHARMHSLMHGVGMREKKDKARRKKFFTIPSVRVQLVFSLWHPSIFRTTRRKYS